MKKKYFFLILLVVCLFGVSSLEVSAISDSFIIKSDRTPYYHLNNASSSTEIELNKQDYSTEAHQDFLDKFQYSSTDSFYYFDIPTYTNNTTGYYVYTDRLSIPVQYRILNLEEEYYNIVFRVYTMDGKLSNSSDLRVDADTFANYNILSKMNLTAELNSNTGESSVPCIVTPVNSQEATVTCRVKKSKFSYTSASNDYTHLTNLILHFNNNAYKELSNTVNDDPLEMNYRLYVSKAYNYEGTTMTDIDVSTSVSNETVSVSVSGYDTTKPIKNVQYRLYRASGSTTSGNMNSTDFTINRLSNGTYTIEVIVYYEDGSNSAMGSANFTIVASNYPVLQWTTSKTDYCYEFDLTSSYSPAGLELTYYYIPDGEWVEIPDGILTICDSDLTTYYGFTAKIVDSEGRETVGFVDWNPNDSPVVDPGEEEKPWYELLWESFINIFIPTTEQMQSIIEDMKTSFQSKFGFLAESVEYLIDEINYFITTKPTFTALCFPEISLPEQIGDLTIVPANTCITKDTLSTFDTAFTLLKTINSFLLLTWFFSYAYNEVQKLLGGDI